MYNRKKSVIIRTVAVIMIMVLIMPLSANAATGDMVQPYASYYLSSYNAYTYDAGGGLVQVWFSIKGAGTMDELGMLTVEIYESTDNSNWTWVETFKHNSTSGMLGYGTNYHSGHVDYQGVQGRYYKAYVCVWGGKDGDGDTRYFWTNVVP